MCLSIISNTAEDKRTGKDNNPRIAVTKNVQIDNGNLVILIPFVRRLIIVTI